MVILGIDPGTTRIGYGVIKKEAGKLSCVDYGLIASTNPDKKADLGKAITDLSRLIHLNKPDVASIEKLFFFKNAKTVMAVSEMRGAILAVLSQNTIPTHEFTPLQVKQAVSSYGRAGKDQVQRMVKLILGIKEDIKPDDAADGLAIAICCAHTIL
ncbi:MAG: crossover junction endodeoxyribonuclease RuvC [Candidatus Yanofskybacteria bacterium RIFCSPHIGHO2_02_FULL_39_10]|uniref:Crossover junction endodeoxyribonuclease RuvC n=1 Tax=Candidatus Yanofskybacteria bacterium RIFCSPHIGHO2_02_FULL_39_10 TaxID=1802674 RepID=A0A1F8F6V2_9BACT|nr:MAG: crossover junction endodeoxyribonuclease RuvC [Candidatus Yanofskybacteria bacterium RIFCSPHIGHO2_02_FULL_39_10]